MTPELALFWFVTLVAAFRAGEWNQRRRHEARRRAGVTEIVQRLHR